MPTTLTFGTGAHDVAIPAGVTSLTVDLYGAAGGGPLPGLGGRVQGTIAVTPGEVLRLVVGGQGATGGGGAFGLGGFNGGGSAQTSDELADSGGGGGATDLRRGGTGLAQRIVVAGGGGGGGANRDGPVGTGGAGGGTVGGFGTGGEQGGAPGTQSGGGAGGTSTGGLANGSPGSLGQGGAASQNGRGGAGGGGFYGGGGAGASDIGPATAGGGGGSSLVPVGCTTTSGVRSGAGYAVLTYNRPPSAPNLLSPANNTALNPSQTQRFSWAFSDPDASDSQAAYELRAGIVGSGVWGYGSGLVNTPNAFHDVPAGSFGTGQNLEWQVRTADSLGVWGPWSASRFFSTVAAPVGPTITSPANGSTASTSSQPITWSVPNQDAYQVRRLADSAGAPDTSTVYGDSGVRENAVDRSDTIPDLVNGRPEHIQVRVRYQGLWSDWSSILLYVDYTVPAVPVASVSPDDATGSITVTASHPAPTGTQPTVVGMHVYRREGGGEGIRLARDLPPNQPWTDYTPASGVAYDYRVAAVGANGTTSLSAWQNGGVLAFSGLSV